MVPETEPDEQTLDAERAEARRDHGPDRSGDPGSETAGENAAASLSEDDRERVRRHEQEMAERGVHQEGEGKID